MFTISLKFHLSSNHDQEGFLFYQITKDKKAKQISPAFSIFTSEWDEKNSRIKSASIPSRKEKIDFIREETKWHIRLLQSIIDSKVTQNENLSLDQIIRTFNEACKPHNFFAFMHSIILELQSFGKEGTLKNYRAAFNSLFLFCKMPVLHLSSVTPEFIGRYQKFLIRKNIVPNSISFYMRILRAVYNRAVQEALVPDSKPFKRACTGIYPTNKRALSQSGLKKIIKIDLSSSPSLDYARDIFMLSFFLRGMSFIDMAYLKKSDLKNRHIEYWRRKTGKPLQIEWTREMEKICSKYKNNSSLYLLPIFRSDNNDRQSFNRIYTFINRNLKKVGSLLHLDIPLTLYVARHSWATFAKTLGIPINIISDGLGHNSESTTRIYLKSLESNLIDAANSKIISSLA